jgi:hypothetical protein
MKTFLAAILTALLLVFATTSPSRADADSDAIKSVIESQLNAFAADDGTKAYSYAAPMVQQVFPSVDMFMGMVKQGYQPVYRNTNRVFGDAFQDPRGSKAMRVILTDQSGKRHEAIYVMEKQPDGSWKIAGCVILEIKSQEV